MIKSSRTGIAMARLNPLMVKSIQLNGSKEIGLKRKNWSTSQSGEKLSLV